MTKRTKPIAKPNREVVLTAMNISDAEARFLVSNYYLAQEARKRADMQIRHLGDKAGGKQIPQLLTWTGDASDEIEKVVKFGLHKYAEGSAVGLWCLAQHGVAGVITAGLLAHIDIEKAPTAGHIWSFAGQNPEQKWEKGAKRPYNASLKQVVYHLGECFKRTSNSPDSFYGTIYRSRKELVVKRNETGFNAERAKTFKTQSAEVRKVLATGKLPAGNLDRQACNYAAKIFLSHLHTVMFWDRYGKAPPKPFAVSILGHAHEIPIPHIEMFPGLKEALEQASAFRQAAE